MQTKGEVAFSTIVVVIIAAAVLILVLIWILPQYSDLFGKTKDIQDIAVGDIDKLECEKFCLDAQELSAAEITAKTPFCDKGCTTDCDLAAPCPT